MDKFFSQFRRLYNDDGRNDYDFTKQEEAVKASQDRLKQATQELIRASQRLHDAAMDAAPQMGNTSSPPDPSQMHQDAWAVPLC